jgi:HSP20 family protein
MNIRPIDNNDNDWFNRFFDFGGGLRKRLRGGGFGGGLFDMDPFKAYEELETEMERMFGQFKDIQTNAPKDLVREYQTPDGAKVREIGPIVYGYSMTVGPDGKPKVREFGNVKQGGGGQGLLSGAAGRTGVKQQPQISAEREPLVDVNSTDKEVKVVLEIPGVKKEDIKINAYDEGAVEVTANNQQRNYHKTIELPKETNTETARSTYHNGILELTFDKKENAKPKGKEIRIE